MLDSPALRHVLVKAKDKVSDVFGDLEKVGGRGKGGRRGEMGGWGWEGRG